MEDSTQAFAWFNTERGCEWTHFFEEVTGSVEETPGNRYHRANLYRTACHTFARHEREAQALPLAQKVIAISGEDPTWGNSFWMKINGYTLLAEVCLKLNDEAGFSKAVADAKQEIARFSSTVDPVASPEVFRTLGREIRHSGQLGRYRAEGLNRIPILGLRGACTQLGIVLYRSKLYGDAAHFLEMAISYRLLYPYLAECYAGALWMHTRDASEVARFIEKASPIFGDRADWWRYVPELQDFHLRR